MLVYYFVPFIVSIRYLLFWVSNGHNSVTVQNWHMFIWNFSSQRPRKSPPAVMPLSRETSCIYRVSQEESARLRVGVPYVKVHRYNPKHICPKLNGDGDNGQRSVWFSGGSTRCTCQLTALSMLRRWVWYHMRGIQPTLTINRIRTSFRVMT